MKPKGKKLRNRKRSAAKKKRQIKRPFTCKPRRRKVGDILTEIQGKLERAKEYKAFEQKKRKMERSKEEKLKSNKLINQLDESFDEDEEYIKKFHKNKAKGISLRDAIAKEFADIENCGGEIAAMKRVDKRKRQAQVKKKKSDRLCPTFLKFRLCYNGVDCKYAHNVDELSVPYKPHEWVGYFNDYNFDKKQFEIERKEEAKIWQVNWKSVIRERNEGVSVAEAKFNDPEFKVDKIVNTVGRTLLSEAAFSNNIAVARQLLEMGGDPTKCDWKGYDSICYAIMNNNEQLLQELIQNSSYVVDLDKPVAKLRGTYLIFATKIGSISIIQLLLELGSDPSSTDDKNQNGLTHAIERNNITILKILLDAGAEVNIYSIHKKDPLQMCFENKQFDMVKMLVQENAAINTRNRRGRQLLFFACDYNDFELLRILQERGISLLELDDYGSNVVMRTYLAKNIEMTKKLLIDCGMKNKLNHQNSNGETLLMLTIKERDNYFFAYLIKNFKDKIDLSKRDNHGRKCLLIACRFECEEIIDLLIQNGSDLNQKDENRQTPIMAAIMSENITIVRKLFSYNNVKVTSKDRMENSAYDYAKSDELKDEIYMYMAKHDIAMDKSIEEDFKRRRARANI